MTDGKEIDPGYANRSVASYMTDTLNIRKVSSVAGTDALCLIGAAIQNRDKPQLVAGPASLPRRKCVSLAARLIIRLEAGKGLRLS